MRGSLPVLPVIKSASVFVELHYTSSIGARLTAIPLPLLTTMTERRSPTADTSQSVHATRASCHASRS